MSAPHLGARVTSLVDGRLATDAEARAADHLRDCSECADAVESERLLRARLQAMGTPEISQDLMVRLLDIGGPSGPLPPRDRPMANPARPVVGVAPPSRFDAARAREGRDRQGRGPAGRAVRRLRRRPVAAALAGTFSLFGAGIVGVLVLGVPGGATPAPVAELRTTPSASPSSTPVSRVLPPTAPSVPSGSVSPTSTGTPTTTP